MVNEDIPPILVLRASDICYLGILRSCREAGLRTVSIVYDYPGARPWYSSYSNAVDESYSISNPYTHPSEALKEFTKIVMRLSGKWGQRLLVLPSSDTILMFVVHNYKELSKYVFLLGDSSQEDPRLDVQDKNRCALLLHRSGANVAPNAWACRSEREIPTILDQARLPVILKPSFKDYGQSFYRTHQQLKAVRCDTRMDLAAALHEEVTRGFELIVQEFIEPGSPADHIMLMVYSDKNHRVRQVSICDRELIDPWPYGSTVIARYTWKSELLAPTQQIVEALQWRGMAMMEFIFDQTSKEWKMIDFNGRPWLHIDFDRKAGLNYLACVHNDLTGQFGESGRVQIAAEDVLRESFFEIDLATAHKVMAESLGSELEAFLDWLRSIGGSMTEVYFSKDDPQPGVEMLRNLSEKHSWESERIINAIEEMVVA